MLSTRPSKAFVALWQQHSVFFSWYFALHASPTFFFSNTIFEGDVRLAKLPLFPSMSEERSMRFGGEKAVQEKIEVDFESVLFCYAFATKQLRNFSVFLPLVLIKRKNRIDKHLFHSGRCSGTAPCSLFSSPSLPRSLCCHSFCPKFIKTFLFLRQKLRTGLLSPPPASIPGSRVNLLKTVPPIPFSPCERKDKNDTMV